MHSKSFSILAENKAIFIREDSQIDFATGNFCQLFSQTSTSLPAFQPKIGKQFKACSLDDADDTSNWVLPQESRPIVYVNAADRQSGMSLPIPNWSKFKRLVWPKFMLPIKFLIIFRQFLVLVTSPSPPPPPQVQQNVSVAKSIFFPTNSFCRRT